MSDYALCEYSKGMKVRLNFARSLIHQPKILFLDEPTAGLDPVNARKIKDLVLEMRQQGTTVFVTTHNMNVADELCDRGTPHRHVSPTDYKAPPYLPNMFNDICT